MERDPSWSGCVTADIYRQGQRCEHSWTCSNTNKAKQITFSEDEKSRMKRRGGTRKNKPTAGGIDGGVVAGVGVFFGFGAGLRILVKNVLV